MQKVFCIGFHKTGTTSIEHALTALGYRVASVFGRDLPIDTLRATFVTRGLEIARNVDAVQDMPWPLMFRELDAAYPDAKFILTLRDEQAWWRSILGHFGNRPDVLQQLTYGDDAAAPLGNEGRYRSVYRTHNADVLEHFATEPDRLLTLDASRPMTWEPLCRFLGTSVPDRPFPRAQQRFQDSSLKRTVRRGALFALNWLASATSRT